jgi:hypothetical protein
VLRKFGSRRHTSAWLTLGWSGVLIRRCRLHDVDLSRIEANPGAVMILLPILKGPVHVAMGVGYLIRPGLLAIFEGKLVFWC